MEEQQNDALIQRSGSSETMNSQTRNSNAKAFKVAGLTVLACLLLAGQVVTAYLVLGQRDHISALEKGQENLKMELTRRVSGAPKIMQVPKNSMPLLKSFVDDDSDPKETVPLSRLQKNSFQREGSGLIYDVPRLEPRRIQLPMSSLPLATEFTDEKTEGDSDEAPMSTVGSKCQLEATKGVKPGVFKPQCDEQGNYLPMQCWHSTGFCWCVDKDGHEIPQTAIRGKPKCGDVN